MSDINEQNSSTEAVPFFARFLEEQDYQEELSEEEAQQIGGGHIPVLTKKYPSDDENVGGGIVATKKYPSDKEDIGGGGPVTLKYPSDSEDGGGDIVTLKFPSDREDLHQKIG